MKFIFQNSKGYYVDNNSLTLEGLKYGNNPETGAVCETELRQLLVSCHEKRDEKSFSPEQYAFLQGYLAALWNIQGNSF